MESYPMGRLSNSRSMSNPIPGEAENAVVELPTTRGEPLRYRPEMGARILERAALGEFPEHWAQACGVQLVTLYYWARKYPEFRAAMRAAWQVVHSYWSRMYLDIARGTEPVTLLQLKAIERIMTRRFPEVWEQARLTEHHFDASMPDTEERSVGPPDRHDDLACLTDEVSGVSAHGTHWGD